MFIIFRSSQLILIPIRKKFNTLENLFHIIPHIVNIVSLLSIHCALSYCKVLKEILTVDPDI